MKPKSNYKKSKRAEREFLKHSQQPLSWTGRDGKKRLTRTGRAQAKYNQFKSAK